MGHHLGTSYTVSYSTNGGVSFTTQILNQNDSGTQAYNALYVTSTNTYYVVGYSPKYTFATGDLNNGKAYYTTDLVNYTELTGLNSLYTANSSYRYCGLFAIEYNGFNKYIALGPGLNGITAAQSSDGINWTGITNLSLTFTFANNTTDPLKYFCKYINGYWVVGGGTSNATNNNIYYSVDNGSTWTSQSVPVRNAQGIAYWNGIYLIVGTSGSTSYAATSPDLINWTSSATNIRGLSVISINNAALGCNGFIVGGNSVTPGIYRTTDGITYTLIYNKSGSEINSLCLY